MKLAQSKADLQLCRRQASDNCEGEGYLAKRLQERETLSWPRIFLYVRGVDDRKLYSMSAE